MSTALTAEEVLKRAHAVGDYYGFAPYTTLAIQNRGRSADRKQEVPTLPPLGELGDVVASLLKQCRDLELVPTLRTPVFVWHSNIAPGRPAPRTPHVQFHAIGADTALADAVVIHAMRALVHDLTKGDTVVRINTLGDKETRARFARELAIFFKKHSATLPEDCLTIARHDVFEAAALAIERSLGADLPSSTDFLSDQSRKRFEHLLEYLEATNTPYELAPDLLSRGFAWSETCFQIGDAGATRAWGSRYGDLARAYFKAATPASGAILTINTEAANGKTQGKVPPMKSRARLRFAFVHIGDEAKRESIMLAEGLRRARLPVWQVIGLESLTEQMLHVEKMNPPYLIIMGRKEALERSVTLRNRATQEEIAIPIPELSERLRAFA